MNSEKLKETLDNLPLITEAEAIQLINEGGATNRYEALGLPLPDPKTMCKGQCDGLGFYPCKNDEEIEPIELAAWLDQHNAPDAHDDDDGKCDGWHFIKCFECAGTGLAFSNTVN